MLEKLIAILVLAFATSVMCDASGAAHGINLARCHSLTGWEAEMAKHGLDAACAKSRSGGGSFCQT